MLPGLYRERGSGRHSAALSDLRRGAVGPETRRADSAIGGLLRLSGAIAGHKPSNARQGDREPRERGVQRPVRVIA